MKRPELVNVLHEDPDLGRCLAPARLEEAGKRATVRVVSMPAGDWADAKEAMHPGGLGLLVIDGVLLRRVSMAERHSLDPVGVGDLVRPYERRDWYAMVPAEIAWRALTPVRFAVLDVRFTRRMCEFPEVIDELVGRVSHRSAAQAVRLAILQQPRLSARLHFVFWHLADRFGLVKPEGVALPLQLSHEVLAQLVGAQRPPVSRALKELERAGLITRCRDGSWWLGRMPSDGLARLVPQDEVADR